ncbi:MAG: EscR/YscR/HrcR family type III secretion system export apparatus protein [Candidatus Paceibacterota bacterium]
MNTYNLLFVSILLAIVPFLMVIGTAYLKVNIVLNIFKNAIGAQQVPSGVIIGTLSLAISLMIMQPVWEKTKTHLLSSNITNSDFRDVKVGDLMQKIEPILQPWKEFIQKNAGENEISFLSNLKNTKLAVKQISADNHLSLTITAFILSELREAFQMGLMILLPFLIIDFLIANILAGLGMMMFSPILLSLPLKILLIVGLDFWQLIFKALFLSYS